MKELCWSFTRPRLDNNRVDGVTNGRHVPLDAPSETTKMENVKRRLLQSEFIPRHMVFNFLCTYMNIMQHLTLYVDIKICSKNNLVRTCIYRVAGNYSNMLFLYNFIRHSSKGKFAIEDSNRCLSA